MKNILVVQLLRVGDVILSLPALRYLRLEYPEANISLLMNDGIGPIQPFLNDVDKIITFPRSKIQKKALDRRSSITSTLDDLNSFCKRLSKTEYDLVVNLTQNHLSALILQKVRSKKFIGLKANEYLEYTIKGRSFLELNRAPDEFSKGNIHYLDYYNHSIENMAVQLSDVNLDSNKAQTQLKYIAPLRKPYICLQMTTSDLKKSLTEDFFFEFSKIFTTLTNKYSILILGAPFEEDLLNRFRIRCEAKGIKINVAICNLEEAYHILCQAKLLVSLDTSVKHLAAAAGVQTLELAVGSSDPSKTGVYLDGSIIIRPKSSCWPCAHSSRCTEIPKYHCREKISPELVSIAALKMLEFPFELGAVYEEYKEEVYIYKVKIHRETGFQLFELDSSLSDQLYQLVNKWISIKKLKNENLSLDRSGTLSIEFHRVIKQFIGGYGEPHLNSSINEVLTRLHCSIGELYSGGEAIEGRLLTKVEFSMRLKKLRAIIQSGFEFDGALMELKELSNVSELNIYHLRSVQEIEKKMRLRLELAMKMLRNLQSNNLGRIYEI